MSMNDDPAFQFLARASGFLEAARIVVEKAGNKAVLRAPVAHLIAHALEVLMKHVLVTAGDDLDSIRRDYGHSLTKLWDAPEMYNFRSLAYQYARVAWDSARESGQYLDDFSDEPDAVLNKYILELNGLHSKESNYALRYVSGSETRVPRPLFLLDTFQPLKDELARAYSRSERATPNG